MLTVWGRKTSSNVQALMWCIGELDLPFERLDIGHRFGGTDTDSFATMNPNRTIPVLRDDETPPLWETGCILRYLATKYADGKFWPPALLDRTEVDRWAEWAKLNVAMAFTVPVFWRVVRTKAAERDDAAIRDAVEALEKKLGIADDRMQRQPYLAGEDFTLADIQLGHVLFRYYDIDIQRADLPSLARYYARLTRRVAFKKHVMISYEELGEA